MFGNHSHSGKCSCSDFIVLHDLARRLWWKAHVILWDRYFHGHSPQYHVWWHCGSRDMMFLVVEGYNFTCSCFNPPLLSISISSTQHNNSDPGHTFLKQQLWKNLKITFASWSKNEDENEKVNNGLVTT